MKNCTWNDNATWHNITPIDIEDDSSSTSSIKGRQDAAEWFGLRALPADTGKFEDSLPYYIGVINIIYHSLCWPQCCQIELNNAQLPFRLQMFTY